MSLIGTFKKIKDARNELHGLLENVAIIFIDLSGSTEFKSEKGIELGVEKVVTFNIDVTKIIEVKGVEFINEGRINKFEIVKYIGDEVMAYCKGNDCCKCAIETSVEIQNYFNKINTSINDDSEKFKPKIGLDFGEVLLAQYFDNAPLDPHGLVVDRAARIVSLAKPQQILISNDVKSCIRDVQEYQTGEPREVSFKGIKGKTIVHEVIWNSEIGETGIKTEERPIIYTIASDAPTVYQFLNENKIFENNTKIDLILYTAETLLANIREKLRHKKSPLSIRILIRNPAFDKKKSSNIQASLQIMNEISMQNNNVIFSLRFYNDDPLFRTYIFHNNEVCKEALLGLYRYSKEHPYLFIGAENNWLIHTKGRTAFEERLQDIIQSRFDRYWEIRSHPKAVIFDVDGVIIDSMKFYHYAWKEAFAQVGIQINQQDVYEREGEKSAVTADELYKKYKHESPTKDLIKMILNNKDRIFYDKYTVSIFPGIENLIEILHKKKIRLALVTGSTSLQDKFGKHSSILDAFDVKITGHDTERGKPHPDPYLMAVQKLRLKKDNCCVIENAPLGIQSATGAGLFCLAVRNNSPISAIELKSNGATNVYQNTKELIKHLSWIDTNLPMKDILKIFE